MELLLVSLKEYLVPMRYDSGSWVGPLDPKHRQGPDLWAPP